MIGLNLFMTLFLVVSSLLWSGPRNTGSMAMAQAASDADIVRVGEDVKVGEGERVAGDVVVFNGDIIVDGEVTGSTTAIGGDVTVRGRVTGDAVAISGNVRLEPNSFVGNDAVSAGGRVIRQQGAIVDGKVVEGVGVRWNVNTGLPDLRITEEIGPGNLAVALLLAFFRAIAATIFLVVVGLVCAVVLPKPTARLADTLLFRPGLTTGIGFLTAFLLPFFMVVGTVVLAITIIGVLVIPLFFFGVFLLALFGLSGLGLTIGERVLISLNPHNTSRPLAAILGMVLLSVVTVIPLAFLAPLGIPLTYLAIAFGLALVVLSRVGTVSPVAPAPPETTV